MTRTRRISLLLAASALVAGAQAASADVRISIGGRGHVRFGGGPVRAHWVRHHGGVHVGGAIWIGGSYTQPFAQPPPPPPPPQACNCETTYYPPIAPAPIGYAYPVTTVAAPVAHAPLPRLGLGVFLGGVAVDGEHEGKDAGLVGQLRVGRHFLIEGEIAKNELAGGARVDRRIMAGLQFELRPYSRMTPYAVAAIGTSQVQVGDTWEDNQSMGEIGGGLRFRMSDRFSLFGDLRVGQRQLSEDAVAPLDAGMARVAPGADENYSRMRLGGLVTF